MSIKVRYFASLKEIVGRSEEELDGQNALTVSEIWQKVNAGKPLPDNVLAAVNMDYVEFDHSVKDGDEVAFFPPVTGG
ncbi:MAG: molybdopterin converting factor subunit 1 [Gammaproteobacteria bacterium HGW-Gammaproteobacteria-3]|jgi:molybdopterin synthase sulfur carrier subunit|nr:MAG: molybdopterin converting factor subunit 1 [Gammaproteobacteria bacterium HGW-Gammaproteobacteria-3]